jgi:hypothetical protein
MNIFSILNLRTEFDEVMRKSNKSCKSDIDSLRAFVKQCTRPSKACVLAKAIIGEINGTETKFVRGDTKGTMRRL